jgi:hypothetical protein
VDWIPLAQSFECGDELSISGTTELVFFLTTDLKERVVKSRQTDF